jgi:Domain of unknown function (DUF4326)
MVDFKRLNERNAMLKEAGVKIYNKRDKGTPPDVRYCGRPTILGNPFEIGRDGSRDGVCDKFDLWLDTGESFGNNLATEERRQQVLAEIPKLKNQDLECWCYPLRCHCESLARRAHKS